MPGFERVRVRLVSRVHMGGVRSSRACTSSVHQDQAVFVVAQYTGLCVCLLLQDLL
jgi:hypothetical protein